MKIYSPSLTKLNILHLLISNLKNLIFSLSKQHDTDDEAATMTHVTETEHDLESQTHLHQPEPLHLESSSKVSIISSRKGGGAMSDRTETEAGGAKKSSRKGTSRKSTGKSHHAKSASSKSGTKTPAGTEKEHKMEDAVKELESEQVGSSRNWVFLVIVISYFVDFSLVKQSECFSLVGTIMVGPPYNVHYGFMIYVRFGIPFSLFRRGRCKTGKQS